MTKQTRTAVGYALKSERLLGGQEWSGHGVNHVLCDDGKTACGVWPRDSRHGWFTDGGSVRRSDLERWQGEGEVCGSCKRARVEGIEDDTERW